MTTSCSKCGVTYSESRMFCASCGSKVGVRCQHCGSAVLQKDSFCGQCGQSLANVEQAHDSSSADTKGSGLKFNLKDLVAEAKEDKEFFDRMSPLLAQSDIEDIFVTTGEADDADKKET